MQASKREELRGRKLLDRCRSVAMQIANETRTACVIAGETHWVIDEGEYCNQLCLNMASIFEREGIDHIDPFEVAKFLMLTEFDSVNFSE